MKSQDLKGILHELFDRVISGTSIEPKNIEQYNNVIDKLDKYLRNLARQEGDEASIKRMKKLQNAIQIAFEKMEEEIERRLNDNSSSRWNPWKNSRLL